MTGINDEFTIQGSPRIASFGLTDLATGKGYVIFYAGQTNATPALSLSVNTFYSDLVTFMSGTFTASVGSPTKVLDRDYDIDFKQTGVIEGNAFVNVPIGVKNGGSAGQNHSIFAVVRIRKFDTAEVEIASATGRIHGFNGIGGFGTMAINAEETTLDAFTVAIPRTKINSGDKLRLTIEFWHEAGGAVDAKVFIGQDPKNRATGDDPTDTTNWGTTSSQISAQMPFRIGLT